VTKDHHAGMPVYDRLLRARMVAQTLAAITPRL
jgi:hypothetical protein